MCCWFGLYSTRQSWLKRQIIRHKNMLCSSPRYCCPLGFASGYVFLRELGDADDVRPGLRATSDQLKDACGNAFCLFQTQANDDRSGIDSNVSLLGVIFLESNVDHHSTSNFESYLSGMTCPQYGTPTLSP